jgi:hypothetical protein
VNPREDFLFPVVVLEQQERWAAAGLEADIRL